MTRRKTIRRSCFHVCVHGIVLLATLRDASKKKAEKRKAEEQGWPTAQSLKVIFNKRDLVVGHCYVSHA